MSSRMGIRKMMNMANIDTSKCHATYFPFAEGTTKIGYSCNSYGWTASLRVGDISGRLYFVDDIANDCYSPNRSLVERMGEREKAIVQNLATVEEDMHAFSRFCVMRFVGKDGDSFEVVTDDCGHTWNICG